MRYRLFGRTGLRVSNLFLGTMTFGENWGWGAAPDDCRAMVSAYLDAGGNVIDTANNYTDGASEQIVGEILQGDRDRIVLTTKYTLSTDEKDPNAAGNHRKSLHRSLEQSLRRLRTDYLDLLWVHIWDQATPVEETMRALDDVVRAGKVLYVGISDTPAWVVSRADMLAELRGWSQFAGLQLPYSLVQRQIERELLPMADGLGLSVAAWSPLAGGVLSGKFTRETRSGAALSRVDSSSISEKDLAIARQVDDVADEIGVSSAQVALAWTRARRPNVHPIVGARHRDQLSDNLACLDVGLPDDALEALDAVSAIGETFPYDFIESTREFVYGPRGADVRR